MRIRMEKRTKKEWERRIEIIVEVGRRKKGRGKGEREEREMKDKREVQ